MKYICKDCFVRQLHYRRLIRIFRSEGATSVLSELNHVKEMEIHFLNLNFEDYCLYFLITIISKSLFHGPREF